MTADVISLSVVTHDRTAGAVSFTVSNNDSTAYVDLDFGTKEISVSEWGDGHHWLSDTPIREQEAPPPHTSRWELAGQWTRALTSPRAMVRFLRAVGSRRRLGPVSLLVLDHRHQCCHGTTLAGVRVSEPCKHRHETTRGVFCKECGCVEWQTADIGVDAEHPERSKLACPDLDCPNGYWSAMTMVREPEPELQLQGADHG